MYLFYTVERLTSEIMEKINAEFRFHSEKNRLETFKNWPFTENCACTPEKASFSYCNGLQKDLKDCRIPPKYYKNGAGFVYCGSDQEPDLVRCYVCLKELDGWVPDDDPWQEHVSHSSKCPFIKNNNPAEVTFSQFIILEKTRVLNIATRYILESNSQWNKGVSSLEELMGSQGKYKI